MTPSEEAEGTTHRKARTMFSTIVVGTDGSEDATRAVEVAAELAAAGVTPTVHVVTAYHPLSLSELRRLSTELPEEFRPLLHSHVGVDATTAAARRILDGAGVEATYHEVDGYPVDALLEMAERADADLIIVGSRGEGMAKRLLHGSVSTAVFHHASCAVLVVRADS